MLGAFEVMRIQSITTFICALSLICACATGNKEQSRVKYPEISTWNTEQLLIGSRNAANDSIKTHNRSKAAESARRGMAMAEACLMRAPEEAGCYYWRAVNTGLYYRVHIIGYQDGVKSMISDCNKVITLDERYDHAGAFRMLGELYAKLPQTAGRADSVTRDLDLAEQNLRKAVQLAPEYPENQLALAELFVMQDKTSDAIAPLSAARNLTPQWKNDASYDEWKSLTLALEKKVEKAGKK